MLQKNTTRFERFRKMMIEQINIRVEVVKSLDKTFSTR